MEQVYTLECNYDSGVKPNALPPRHGTYGSSSSAADTARMSPEPEVERLLSPKYTPECWQEIGKALALSALDLANANPCSRLGPLGGEGLGKLRTAVVAAQQRKAYRRKTKKSAKGGALLGTRERWGDDDDDDDDDDDEEGGEEVQVGDGALEPPAPTVVT